MFTENEKKILDLLSGYRNYDNIETELQDNVVGFWLDDLTNFVNIDLKTARGVIASLIKKGMIFHDFVNGEPFFTATNKCIEYLYSNY